LLVLEKATCRPKIYVGSGTESQYGVSVRLSQYDRKNSLPRYVQQAIDDGYIIVHKGLLCWTAIPPPSLVPKIRLLFFLLEATFAYAFWAMRTTKNDYNMTHICPWAVNVIDMAPEFGYDGLCSYCSLGEGVSGDFGLSEEQLEALAAQKKEARAAAKSVYGSSVHFEQMANNHDEYLEKQAGYKVVRRAQDGGEYHRQNARDNAAKHHKAKTHFCEPCKRSFPTAHFLSRHKKTKPHLNKAEEMKRKHICHACNYGSNHRGTFNTHMKGARHLKKAAAAAAAPSSFQLD
jgi:hypothetical protein